MEAHDQKRPMTVVFDSRESLRDSPPQEEEVRLLSLVRFDSKVKVEELVMEIDSTLSKASRKRFESPWGLEYNVLGNKLKSFNLDILIQSIYMI